MHPFSGVNSLRRTLCSRASAKALTLLPSRARRRNSVGNAGLDLSTYFPYLINRVGMALVERFTADALAGDAPDDRSLARARRYGEQRGRPPGRSRPFDEHRGIDGVTPCDAAGAAWTDGAVALDDEQSRSGGAAHAEREKLCFRSWRRSPSSWRRPPQAGSPRRSSPSPGVFSHGCMRIFGRRSGREIYAIGFGPCRTGSLPVLPRA